MKTFIRDFYMGDKSARHLTIALTCLVAGVLFQSVLYAEGLKKIRMGIASMNVSYLTFFAGLQKGFFKDEGIDLELILMSPTTPIPQFWRAISITTGRLPALLVEQSVASRQKS